MSNLPRTDLCDLPEEERAVAEALIATLGDDLTALAWHGSRARGEAKPASDHDMIIILRSAGEEVLLRLHKVFRERTEWSVFVQTEEELRQYPRHGRLQFHFGVSLLYGDFEPPPYTPQDVLNEIRTHARDLRFECRYRLLHSEPLYSDVDEQFQRSRNARMLRYAAKLGVMALKARELLRRRGYPLTMNDLRQRLSDSDELAVIDTLEHWTESEAMYEEDHRPLALLLDRFARKLVAELPTE